MLKTRNIFIDTQTFLQNRLRFDHPTLRRLRELCASGQLHLVLSETVVGEVRSKLHDQMQEASRTLLNLQKSIGPIDARIEELHPGLHAKLDEDFFIQEGYRAWNDFLLGCAAEIIRASEIDASDLLSMYFKKQAPFGDGKKKSEFPDAISSLSIDNWLKNNPDGIYVISADSDFEKWCESHPSATAIKSIPELLDLYNTTESALTELVHELYKKEEVEFLKEISNCFLNKGFQYGSNWEAEVTDVHITSIDISDFGVIEAFDEEAVISVSAKIDFSARIEGPDYDNAIWDSEDKRYAYLPTFDIAEEFSEHFGLTVTFSFDRETKKFIEITDISPDESSDITIFSDVL